MSKSNKSLVVLSCAIAPMFYGAAAFSQDLVTVKQYADGNPPALPEEWPGASPNTALGLGGPSATGTNPVLGSNFFNGQFNDNVNGAPNNGGQATVDNPMGTGSGAIAVLAQTFQTTSSFKLGGISFYMANGGDAGFMANAASIHLYQLNSTVTPTSTTYNLSTQAVGYVSPTQDGDLLGGGQGAFWTPSAVDNIDQFVFSGADQVTLQANTEYAIELYVDQVDSGDSLGLIRMSGADSDPGPVPYTGGAEFAVVNSETGADDQTYSNNATVTRESGIFAGPLRESIFAVYAAPPTTVTGTWTGTAGDSNWSTANNWVSSAVPGTTAGDSALFTSVNNTATTQLVNLNGNQTVGSITFNNAGSLYTIAQGTSGTLTLQNFSGSAHIDDLIGHAQAGGQLGHTISAPIAINGGLQIAVGQAADTLILSGNISGSGGITLNGDTQSQMVGTVVLSGTNTYTGGTTVDSGTLLIQPTATPSKTASGLATGALTIGSASAAGEVVLGSNVTLGSQSTPTATSNVNITSLSITANSTLDITNNHIIINYGSGTDPIASIAALIKSGFNSGAWNGPGIISSAAQTTGATYGIGYADAADAGNPAGLASGQIEVAYTLLGDANLDGKVNGTDFAILATNFNQAVTSWDQGDFNYDGKDNGTDFAFLASNFNQGASQAADMAALEAFAAEHGLSLNVPEPASFALFTVGALGAMRRRRRADNQ